MRTEAEIGGGRPERFPADMIAAFRRAVRDELEEARTRPTTEPVPLVSGRRVVRLGDRVLYRFQTERVLPKTLTEGAEVALRLAAPGGDGGPTLFSQVSVQPGSTGPVGRFRPVCNEE